MTPRSRDDQQHGDWRRKSGQGLFGMLGACLAASRCSPAWGTGLFLGPKSEPKPAPPHAAKPGSPPPKPISASPSRSSQAILPRSRRRRRRSRRRHLQPQATGREMARVHEGADRTARAEMAGETASVPRRRLGRHLHRPRQQPARFWDVEEITMAAGRSRSRRRPKASRFGSTIGLANRPPRRESQAPRRAGAARAAAAD